MTPSFLGCPGQGLDETETVVHEVTEESLGGGGSGGGKPLLVIHPSIPPCSQADGRSGPGVSLPESNTHRYTSPSAPTVSPPPRADRLHTGETRCRGMTTSVQWRGLPRARQDHRVPVRTRPPCPVAPSRPLVRRRSRTGAITIRPRSGMGPTRGKTRRTRRTRCPTAPWTWTATPRA